MASPGRSFAADLPNAPPREGVPAPVAGVLLAGFGLLGLLIFSNAWQLFVLGPDGDPSASGLARAIYAPAYAAALGLIALRSRAVARAARSGALLIGLMALAAASTLWSTDPDLTARRGVALVLTTVMGLALAGVFTSKDLARLLAGSFLILAAASLLTALLFPALGRMGAPFPGAWRGVWTEKNALGDHMGLGALLCLSAAVLDRSRRGLWTFAFILAIALVVLSTSKTSLVGLGVGLGVFAFVVIAGRGPASAVAAIFIGVCLALAAAAAALTFPDAILAAMGKDATLTGRTQLWAAVVRQAEKRPWLGYGYGSVWNNPDRFGVWAWISKEARFQAAEAHDTWLSVRLDLGFVGLGLYAAYFLQTWMRALWAAVTRPEAVLAVPALAFLSVEQLTETAGLDFNDFVWVIFAALSVRLGLDARSASAAPEGLAERRAGGEG